MSGREREKDDFFCFLSACCYPRCIHRQSNGCFSAPNRKPSAHVVRRTRQSKQPNGAKHSADGTVTMTLQWRHDPFLSSNIALVFSRLFSFLTFNSRIKTPTVLSHPHSRRSQEKERKKERSHYSWTHKLDNTHTKSHTTSKLRQPSRSSVTDEFPFCSSNSTMQFTPICLFLVICSYSLTTAAPINQSKASWPSCRINWHFIPL